MHARLVGSTLVVLTHVAAAGDAPGPVPGAPVAPAPSAKAARPKTPEEAADAVLAAIERGDKEAVRVLAGKDALDPWMVADELIGRGRRAAADAFTKDMVGIDLQALPHYVASRLPAPDDSAQRRRLATATEALARGAHAEVLAATDPVGLSSEPSVLTIRLRHLRGLALGKLARHDEAAAELVATGTAAEALGWLARAARLYEAAGLTAYDGSAYEVGKAAWGRRLAVCERRADSVGAARALASLGVVHFSTGEYARALEVSERALVALEAVGDEARRADVLGDLGNVHFAGGNYAAALGYHERARAAHEALGNKRGVANALGNLGNVYSATGDYERALALQEASLALREAMDDRRGAALALGNIGNVHFRRGDYAVALSAYERALATKERVGDRAGAAATLGNIGAVQAARGDYAAALATQQRALSAKEELGDKAGAALTRAAVGSVYADMGEYARALTALEGALAAKESLGDRPGAAVTLGNLGTVYGGIGDDDRALAAYRRALLMKREIGDRGGAAGTLGNIGLVEMRRGDHAAAMTSLNEALGIMEALGELPGVASLLTNIAAVHEARGELAESVAIFRRALAIFETLGRDGSAATVLANIGTLQGRMGDRREALSTLTSALGKLEAIGDRSATARTLGSIGETYVAMGDTARGMAYARRAVAETAGLAVGLADEEAVGARVPLAFVFEVGAVAALQADDPAELTYFLESGRAGALLAALDARTTLWAAAIPQGLRDLELRARREEARATSELAKAMARGDLPAIREKRGELDDMREASARVVARIQREAKAGAALVYPHPASPSELRSVLREGDALVVYALLQGSACAVVLTPDGERVVHLGSPVAVRETLRAIELDEVNTDPRSGIDDLQRLLVAPLRLPQATKRVLISPSGELSGIPFSLLFPRAEVIYEPSGTTYRLLREGDPDRGEGVLALGDPDYASKADERALAVHRGAEGRLVSLPGTREEAVSVGDVRLLGRDATEAGLKSTVALRPRWRAVHLACHGLVNSERPALSSLAVTATDDDDGFLTCLDVFRTRIPADLVVLSACETGRGKVVKGEGLVGLARAFMFAGAPRVICSLWKVDDAATRALMIKFYELWNPKDGKPGLPTASALMQAQQFVASHEKWRHPYFWAAWTLWGLPE